VNWWRVCVTAIVIALIASIQYIGPVEFGLDLSRHPAAYGVSSPASIVAGLLILLLYFAIANEKNTREGQKRVRVVRRFAAFWVDLSLALVGMVTLVSSIAVTLETLRTRHMAWEFQRETLAWTDVILLFIEVAGFAALFLYFVYPLSRSGQTLGSFVFGFRTVVDEGRQPTFRAATARVWRSYLGLCVWPYTLWKGTDQQGRTWYDRKSGWRVVGV
jgi:uncharacterized RDD family membrane protein YckC